MATSGAGEVVVSLTVTDSAGLTRNVVQAITIAPVAGVVVTPPTSGGGGGGAMGWGWMLGLASAILLLTRRRRS